MIANFNVISDNLDYLLWGRLSEGQPGGVALTLLMAIGAAVLALPGGILLACLAWRFDGLVRRILFLWAEIIRGIPLIFVIFWLWYLLPMLTGSDLPGAMTVTLALAWFTAASVMHSVLAGLQALPIGQREAAQTQGFGSTKILWLILLPQAIRAMLPVIIAQLVVTLKDTALGFIITYPELLYYTKLLSAQARLGSPILQSAIVIGGICIVMCLLLSWLAHWIEKRGRRSAKRAGAGPHEPAADDEATLTEVISMQAGPGNITK